MEPVGQEGPADGTAPAPIALEDFLRLVESDAYGLEGPGQ